MEKRSESNVVARYVGSLIPSYQFCSRTIVKRDEPNIWTTSFSSQNSIVGKRFPSNHVPISFIRGWNPKIKPTLTHYSPISHATRDQNGEELSHVRRRAAKFCKQEQKRNLGNNRRRRIQRQTPFTNLSRNMLAAITSRRLNGFSGPYVEIKEIESIVTK